VVHEAPLEEFIDGDYKLIGEKVEYESGNNSETDSDDDLIYFDEEVTDINRMQLLKMSKSNSFFLFNDRLEERLKVYRLDSISFTFFEKKQRIFQFVPYYCIGLKQLKLMAYVFKMEGKNVLTMNYLQIIKHAMVCGVIKINDVGDVDLAFNSYKRRHPTKEFEIFGSIIKKRNDDENLGLKLNDEFFFVQTVKFEKEGFRPAMEITDKKIKKNTLLLETELMYQHNLPDVLRSVGKTEELVKKIKNLQLR
jgi:hypothetical protein